jgi:pimeloyl-ACP methyl ester carboxylesterase
MKQLPRSWYAVAFQVPGLAELVFTAADRRVFKLLFGGSPDWPDYERRLSEPGALTAGFNWYRANARPLSMSRDDRYPRVQVPTLGVIGSKDAVLTREQMEGSGAFVDGGWRFEEIRAGHWLPLSRADAFNPLLLEFLAT